MPTSWRARCHAVLSGHSPQDRRAAAFFSWSMTALVLANVLAVVLESERTLQARYGAWFDAFDALSIALFSTEYLLRLWSAADDPRGFERPRWRYVRSFHGLIDLLAILPFFLQWWWPGLDLRVLRVLRVMRFLKLSHYSSALEDLAAAMWAERGSLISALYLLALTILISACLMHYAEHDVQPDKLGSIAQAMWWSVVTMTTVGYGDVAPVTPIGQVIGGLTALSGVLTVALLSGIVASAFSTRVKRQEIAFEAELQAVLQDGRITEKERHTIEQLRREFDITPAHARALMRHIRERRMHYHAHAQGTGPEPRDG